MPVSGLIVFTDKTWFPKAQLDGVTTLSASGAIVAVAGAGISADYRRAWDYITAQARTDRASQRAHLSEVRNRKRARGRLL